MRYNMFKILMVFMLLNLIQILFAEEKIKDNVVFVEDKNEFQEAMKKEAQASDTKDEKKKIPKIDITALSFPVSPDEFTKCWFNPPLSQGLTGSCWCFSATSFLESEIYRLYNKEVKLSEMYTVYWEYVEKALEYVNSRGNSVFGKGSQPNAAIRIWKKYGVVPEEAFRGKKDNQKFYDHTNMHDEMQKYLESLKQSNAWDAVAATGTIKSILNYYLGEPPQKINVEGKDMTPKEYLTNILRINLEDYVDVMSLKEKPYYEKAEYEVADNWWHCKEYNNIPLNDFLEIIKLGIKKGYSISIAGDTSESGYVPSAGIALVPAYDIPSDFIDDNARQIRFSSETTSDDHAIHIVGYKEQDGKIWFLIKDSGSSAYNSNHKGYFFYHEDYVKLKMMNYMIHKDIFEQVVKKK